MAEEIVSPFSARNRGAHAQIDNDCPDTTRIGLLHILHRLMDQRYVGEWALLTGELERLARVKPGTSADVEQLLLLLPWAKVFDFCERLYNHLAKDVYAYNSQTEEMELITPRGEIQEYIGKELRQLFLEENLAFEFSDGMVRRRGRRHTAERISRAELVLGDPKLSAARTHFFKKNHRRQEILP